MSPEFASVVDPIILHVINSMERIRSGKLGEFMQLHDTTIAKIRQADAQGLPAEMWKLAKYGLCAWIDDLMINHKWDGQDWWENNKLEFVFFKSNDAGEMFFRNARDAQQVAVRDALEVYYIAVVLGFRGLYRMPNAKSQAVERELPPTIEEWARRTASMVQNLPRKWAQNDRPIPVRGAPPLEGRYTLVGAALLFFALIIVVVVLGIFVLAY